MKRNTDKKTLYGEGIRELLYKIIDSCGYFDVIATIQDYPGETRSFHTNSSLSFTEDDKEEIRKIVEEVLSRAVIKYR
jgi:hypothetical protein